MQLTKDLGSPREWPWSEQPVVVLDRGRPWLYGPVERDPLMTRRGHVALPWQEVRRLRARAAVGPAFQRVAIAHELDPDGPAADLLPALAAGPRTCTDAVARVLVGPQPAHPVVRRAARMLSQAAEKVLDPIVFGVVGSPALVHGRPALWYPLAAWRW